MEFVVIYVWEKEYSSAVLTTPRPPIAAVVADILSLISFLKSSQCWLRSLGLVHCLTDFVRVIPLHSIRGNEVDEKWLVRGYLADMFGAIVLRPDFLRVFRSSAYGLDRNRDNKETLFALDDETTPAQFLFFNLEPPVSAVASDPSVSLDELDASFIESGPFGFRVTNRLDRHLSLDSRNRILIYVGVLLSKEQWGKYLVPFERPDLYDKHFLRECYPVSIDADL